MANEGAVEKHDLDFNAGGHLDDGLILFSALDQILGEHVAGLAYAFTDTALGDVAGRQFLALAVDDGRGPREEAVRVGREIGRASGRERVCQFGEISGVAVEVKKT